MHNKKQYKKILILIPSLRLWWWAEKIAVQIWNGLQKKWYNISYLTFYCYEKEYEFLWSEYCLNDSLNSSFVWKIFRFLFRGYKIKRFCEENNIDIIISFMEEWNFPAILSKLYGNSSKIIISIHHEISNYKKWCFYWFIKLLYRFADNIVVLTKFEKDNLIKNFNCNKNKISVISNGIDIDRINLMKRESLWEYESLFYDKFSFISIWRLEKIKNQELMINSFLKLNEKYTNTQLIVLWDWKEKNNLQKIANNNIHFLWNQNNVFKFLNNSNCFIITSISEAFCIAILEAMSCWLPIISTKTQWANEIIWNLYWLLVNNDIESLYDAMENLYLNKEISNYYKNLSIKRVRDYDMKPILKKREDLLI